MYKLIAIHPSLNSLILENIFKKPNVENILNNTVRPDFSKGHLSRNWNQGIINGFVNLNQPQADYVVLMQNDTFVKNNCFSLLKKYHEQYDFIQQGVGDQLMSFNVDAIKKMGIFDERFCSIGYQEADYFINALMTNRDKISINDNHHGRVYQPLREDFIEPEHSLNAQFHFTTYHEYNLKLLQTKWNNAHAYIFSTFLGNYNIKPHIKRYMYYPYFESDILTLIDQNYFL
ncbi:MAG: hypothetical protein RLZZ86_3644 [Cyanobacteriota bacterium]